MILEGLESRTLLATAPAPLATGAPINLSNLNNIGFEYADSPVVAINPYNSKEIVSVWTVDVPSFGESFVEGDYSTDGGASWNALPGNAANPSGISTLVDFQATSPGVAFDSLGNVYVMDLQHATVTPTGNPVPTTGTLMLSKFSFTGSGAGAVISTDFINDPVYQWVDSSSQSAMLNPVLTVDPGTYPNSTPATSPPAGVPKDPFANNVYIAWASNDVEDPQVLYQTDLLFNPNRIELIVSSDGGQTFSGVTTVNNGGASTVPLGGGLTFTNPDDGNNFDTGTGSIQDNAHPQIVLNPNGSGQITVGWSNLNTGELTSNSVQAGISLPAKQLLNSIGNVSGPLVPDPLGDWAQPVPGASIYNAGPNPGVNENPIAITTGLIDSDALNDIVVTDANGGIGVLLNQGAGVFPGSATLYPAGNNPVFTTLQAVFPGQPAGTILNALVANNTAGGGVSDLLDTAGAFGAPVSFPAGAGTDSIGVGNFDGNGNVIVAVNGTANSISLINPVTGVIIKTLTTGLNDPTNLDVADFNGDSVPDIGVFNASNNTFQFFLGASTGPGNFNFDVATAHISGGVAGVPTNVSALTYATLLGGAGPDIVLTTNSPGKDSIWILQNTSAANVQSVSFTATPLADSGFNGTPVGVAVGQLSTGGNDIAVAYRAATTSESMVAVFRNLGTNLIFKGLDYGFQRTMVPTKTGGDFDAGQTNPTAIALANLSGGAWDDIIVTNNDGRGTVSVLQPVTPPTPSSNPAVNSFPVAVNVANPAAVTGLTASLALAAPNLSNIKITLVAPNGDSIILVRSGALTGTALGQLTEPGDIVTPMVFDDNASQNIIDSAGLTPTIGSWRPQSDYITTETLDQFVQRVFADDPTKFNGNWTLNITDSTALDLGFLQEFSLQFTTGMIASKTQGTISPFSFNEQVGANTFQTVVMPPALGDNYTTNPPSLGTSVASPLGIGPGLVMAQDDTLGPNSPFKGRIYAAFVGYYNVVEPTVTSPGNPIDNTDIFEVFSDDGGLTWSQPVMVNADNSQTDGLSESNDNPAPDDQVTGREQFQPAIAVDQATGTLVISWRDGRDDPSRSRVATYLTTSIDGGQTFGPASYANPDFTAVDAITGKTDILGPQLDNESTGTPTTTPGSTSVPDTEFGYGTNMGLAVFNGQVYPVWAGNFNQGAYDPLTNTVEGFALDIFYRPMVIAAGPRITTSTMGPIPLAEASSGVVTINVTFDRPITISTFSTSDVQVFYHDTNKADGFTQLQVTGITSLGDGMNFQITFNPKKLPNGSSSGITNFTGTYSYLIAPDDGAATPVAISSPVWSFVNGVLRMDDPMDQNADGTADENAEKTAFTGTTPGDVYAVPTPAPTVPITFNGSQSILIPPFSLNTLPLIVPGPQVQSTEAVSSTGAASTGSDDLLLNGTTSDFNLTFDRPILTSTFDPSQVLQISGPAGSVSGPQYFPSSNLGQVIPGATAAGPGVLSSQLSIPSFNGSFKIAKITVEFSATTAADSSLSGVLISPSGTQVPLFAGVGGTSTSFVNTIFDDSSATAIQAGSGPFTGSYRPTGLLATLNGQTVDMPNPAAPSLWTSGIWTLKLTNTNSVKGVLGNWSVSVTPVVTVAPVNPAGGTATTFQIGFPLQQLSGTYTIQLGTGITDAFGDAIDTNQNAGLDVLRGQSQNGPTATVVYSATDLPKLIPAPVKGVAGQVSSTITVPDDFLVQGDKTSAGISGLRVQINMSYPFDPDLTATLFYDMGTASEVSIPLFSGVGGGTNTKNFVNTVFDDNAGTPIQNGSAPFFATFNPQLPLSDFAGLDAKGTWTLVVVNNSTTNGSGTFNSWSLIFQKPLPTSGLGQPGSDNLSSSFRIFTLGQTTGLSSQAWTPVGPAAIGSGSGSSSSPAGSGSVTGLAIDPSDPSGNTVYAAGASGGVWKTTNFLTTSPNGPTWIPLTDFGPTSAVNIGSVTVFPRNSNPNNTIVIAATGDGNTQSPGVGFLISQDGGATWSLADSTVNVDASGNPLPIESTQRDRAFIGTTAFKVVVDPKLTPTGQVIIYAALSGNNGGIWRSEDTGATWQQMLAGQATDVVLDADSGTVIIPDSDTSVQGNLQVVYAGMQGQGVFMSPNQGQVWKLMAGGIGNPLIVNNFSIPAPNVNPIAGPTPNGAEGRIVLGVPASTGLAAQDPIYSGWLYAAVAAPDGTFFGLFETKDFGQNWTQVRIPTLPSVGLISQAIPTNDITQADYPITGGGQFAPTGNQALTIAVDPADPSVVYVGGSSQGGQTGLIRVDTTTVWDAHSLVANSDSATDAGGVDPATLGPAGINQVFYSTPISGYFAPGWYPTGSGALDFTQFENFIRNPDAPFLANATLHVYNYANFTNNGAGAEWIPFDMTGSGYHTVASMVDPTTGMARLIFGNDNGVWSVLDNNGSFETQIGANDVLPDMNRNGNLQITQFVYGAAQPSSAAALIAGALFYGSARYNGGPVSDPSIISDGNITWSGPTGDAVGVATDQQGTGTAYQFFWPSAGGQDTNFFQFIPTGKSGTGNYVGRTFGLLQASNGQPTPDPQWPFEVGANFAVNPVNSSDVVISSTVGRIFVTQDSGVTWFDVGDPPIFGSPNSFSVALAYGAPDPTAPEGIGNLGNFIYVGTQTGQIYVTQDGGGTGRTNDWINVSSGLDGSVVESIIADPTRGSHAAYAVTQTGVFFNPNTIASSTNPSPSWTNITANIHDLQYSIFGQNYDPTSDPNSTTLNQAVGLTSIAADWRYDILINPANPTQGSFPVLYVGANSGVYQSLDNGKSWTLFPDTSYGAIVEGGNLPHAAVTDLDVSVGAINTNTGRPTLAGPLNPFDKSATADPDVLLATTFGRGQFAINLAPLVLQNTFSVSPTAEPASGGPPVIGGPVTISGTSEVTGFGNTTWVTVEDVTDPANPIVVAGYNPNAALPVPSASNSTSADGTFSLNFNPAPLYTTNGLKTIEVFATDGAGAVGNKLQYTFNWDPATHLEFAANGEPPATALPAANFATPSPVIVDAEDKFGNIAIAYNGPVTISLANGATGLAGTLTTNAVAGIATFTNLSIAADGTYNLLGSSPGLVTTDPESTPIVIVGAATQLYVIQQPPSPVVAGTDFGFKIGAEDSSGNPTTIFSGNVSVTIANNPGGSNPAGVAETVPVVGGQAVFSGLKLNKVGMGYTLKVTSGTLTAVTTSGIDVTNAPADHLVITPANEPPSTLTAGQTFGLTVTAEDPFGNVDVGFSGQVTIAILAGMLTGTAKVNVVNGQAVFSGLAIDTAGTFKLLATSSPGLTSTQSTSITVTPAAPSQLVWDTEPPPSVVHNFPFGIALAVEDKYGNAETALNESVTVTLDNNPNSASLGGDTTVNLVNGIASFTDLSITAVGNGYTLQATAGGLVSAPSTPIDVTPTPAASLEITVQPPSSVTVATAFSFQVTALDALGNADGDFNGPVTVALASGPTSQLGGTLTEMAVGGVATFSDLNITTVGNGYTLSVASPGIVGATSNSFSVKAGAAAKLIITTEPVPSVAAGSQFGFIVTAEDQYGNLATSFNGTETITVASGPAGAALSGASTATAAGGIATVSGLILTKAGSNYKLQVSATGLSSATTTAITVTPVAVSQLAISTQPPSSVTAGSTFGLTVTAEDKFANVATGFQGSIAVSLSQSPGTGVLGGTLIAQASGGQAQFSDLHLNTAGSPYTIAASSGSFTSPPSTPITVNPAAASTLVVYIPPPSSMISGAQFGLAIAALDPFGNLATGYTGNVTIALDNNPGNATLSGPLTVAAVGGVANFHAFITTQVAATGYTLQATADGLTSIATGPISVTPAPATHLVVISQPPAVVTPGTTFGFTVAAEDAFGNIATGYTGAIVASVAAGSGATLSGTTSAVPTNGKVTFSGLTLTESSGAVPIALSTSGLTGVNTDSVAVTTPAIVAFATGTVTVSETAGSASLQVVRTSGYSGPISVRLSTSDGTALAGQNYTAIDQVLHFAAGQNSQTITIQVANTGPLSSALTVNLSLSNPGANASLGNQSTAMLVIQSSNQPPPAQPLVTLQSVGLVTNTKHQLKQLKLNFSGALNSTEAVSTAIYELIVANKAGQFIPTRKSLVKVKSAAYSGNAVTLTLKKPLKIKKALELIIQGGAGGLQDGQGRLIDGNHDGSAGGNAVAVVSSAGATVSAVPAGPMAVKLKQARGK